MVKRSGWVGARLGVLVLAAAGVLAASCGGDDSPPPLADPVGSDGGSGGNETDASAGSGGNTTDASPGSGGTTDASPHAEAGDARAEPPAANCGEITCAGEGQQCEVDDEGARCVCRFGYRPVGGEDAGVSTGEDLECEVDKECVKVRFLVDDECRWILPGSQGAPPAIGLFFAVDYCAGTAVLPEDLEELTTTGALQEAFEVTEDGNVIDNSSESSIAIVERDVESYVNILLDASTSITTDQGLLEEVTRELVEFVDELKADDPEVTISLTLFAATVEVAVPFTKDADKIKAVLNDIARDPEATLDPIFAHPIQGTISRSGTALLRAAERGVNETQRMLNLRRVVTNNGVLSSGTVVVITDGGDTDVGERPVIPQVLKDTRLNLITIGISDDLGGEVLSALGRDGEFLAPSSEERRSSFERVARRVAEHPDRAYLLTYCSSPGTQRHTVEVGLKDKPEESQSKASCTFDKGPLGQLECDAEALAQPVNEPGRCGGFLANGACADDECCVDGRCVGPSRNEDCRAANFDFLCRPFEGANTVCIETADDEFRCIAPQGEDDECDDRELRCGDGLTCEDVETDAGKVKRCRPIGLATGELCLDDNGRPLDAEYCPELNCGPSKAGEQAQCLPRARMFQACSSSANAICEVGSYCSGGVCKMRGPNGFFGCTKDEDCASGRCDLSAKLCASAGACHFTWSDVLDDFESL